MDEARPLLEKLSPERVRHELDLILDEPNWFGMLTRLADLGLLTAIHADLSAPDTKFELPSEAEIAAYPVSSMLPPKRTLIWLLWLSPASPVTIRELSRSLRFPAALTKLLLAASALRADLPSLTDSKPSAWVERLEDVPEFAIYALSLSAEGKTKQALLDYLEKWRYIKPKTTGHDLKELGLSPGPKYKSILRQLRAAWLDGKIETAAAEKKLLGQLLE
jgi:tRNA nucleotidyltransferase (CCA-adding enzyme)